MAVRLLGRERECAAIDGLLAHALGQRRGSVFLRTLAEWTLGLIELTTGRTEAAADRLLALTAFGQAEVNPLVSLPAVPDAVEAGVRAGRAPQAAERLAVFRGAAERTPSRSRRALLARCEALLGEREPEQSSAPRPSCGRPGRPRASATSGRGAADPAGASDRRAGRRGPD